MTYPSTVIKGHGTGNDFVLYLDEAGKYEPDEEEIRFLCNRHFGIGADGLIRLTKPEFVSDLDDEAVTDLYNAGALWFMDYRNADGSLAEMCGNGTRVTAALAIRYGLATVTKDEPFMLGTRAGVKVLTRLGQVEGLGKDVFTIDMGPWKMGEQGEFLVSIPGAEGSCRGTFVDMGNPHVVSVVKEPVEFAFDGYGMSMSIEINDMPDIEELDLTRTPVVEPVLSAGQNAEFVRIDSIDTHADAGYATMRVNERGAGETLSCGTGLCAAGVVLRARTGINNWTITVPGGTLTVSVLPDRVYLTGDARLVAQVKLWS
ncbi:diaminopimelate epimerase [Alloscardovia venturai]|uniref:Diaminopimelate epimerase n=1 Tax=Alloscardovia venturai TaxID=1769421 RepID=A0ABW2Y6K1_9BIFI